MPIFLLFATSSVWFLFFFSILFFETVVEEEEAFANSGGSFTRVFYFLFFGGGDSILSQLRRYFGVSLQFQRHSSVTRKSFCEFGRYFFFFLLFLLSSRAKLTSFFVIVHFEINESFLCAPLLSCFLRLLNCLIFPSPSCSTCLVCLVRMLLLLQLIPVLLSVAG